MTLAQLNVPAVGPLTMSSLEIADLTGKRHDNVLRDIRLMSEEMGLSLSFEEKSSGNGRPQLVANLPKRETLILVSGYSTELRARIIDRWMELEAVVLSARPAPQFHIPQTLSEALMLAARQAEQIEQQTAVIAEMQPDVDALERIAKADGSLCLTDAAKALQIKRKSLIQYLSSNGWIYRRATNSHWNAYQARLQTGDLEHKTTTILKADGEEKIVTQVRVLPKGLTKLAKLMGPSLQLAA